MAKKTNKKALVKETLLIISICIIGFAGIIFSVLYINTFNSGFFSDYSDAIIAVSVALISIITILCIVFLKLSKEFIYKLFFVVNILIVLVLTSMYFLKTSGFLDKVDTIEDFRKYIESFNGFAVVLFIIIQFLQVVILPIPSFITVGAGVLLFGPLLGAVYSAIGIISGSIIAFLIGKKLGSKVVGWLIGADNLKKGLKIIKGKDKIVLTFMFLFPFFPDDILCFVAGLTTMSSVYFVVMIVIVRLITIFVSSYSFNNSLIPYDTWWGILLWVTFFILTVLLTIYIYKNGNKFERKIKEKLSKRKR